MNKDELLPREKALAFGLEVLTNKELLALVVKTGFRGNDVFKLSEAIIDKANGFENLLSLNLEELCEIKGIKVAKALELMAILEIAKRLSKIDLINEEVIANPDDLANWIRFHVGFSTLEQFVLIMLNSRGKVKRHKTLFVGSKNAATVATDEVMRQAILNKSSSIVIAHNHPGGYPKPSGADIEITSKLAKAAALFNIPLLDHLIVSPQGYYSFKREGLL